MINIQFEFIQIDLSERRKDMAIARTTIDTSYALMEEVKKKANENNENIGDFITRALVNQLEKEGNFEIRDLMEVELNGNCEKKISY